MPFKMCPSFPKLFQSKSRTTPPSPIQPTAETPSQAQAQVQSPQSIPQVIHHEVPNDPPPPYTPRAPATTEPTEPVEPIETSEALEARRARQRWEEYASERYIQENTKRCPKCHWAVAKEEGCHHMICRCNHSFCWLCLATWEQSVYQDFHFQTCALYPRDQAQQVFRFTGRLFPEFATPASAVYQDQIEIRSRREIEMGRRERRERAAERRRMRAERERGEGIERETVAAADSSLRS
ncbi:hypothetical protein ONS95_000241 [Cadophora gregata]|uniref:uncharacterized protein n=1 Tax=Cadophora gregata TaxID=51156 RepID=UPI0026DC902E|nr:uncharacterized protein ONS95_000241 [Cadophora gregata]KAK0099510.1 hypothetical protein ONS96_008348 [Cadophora gregata f. sp. sojae]KAK0128265.1 hypothetical protein ONS95_000241 [Cadophora gregata]